MKKSVGITLTTLLLGQFMALMDTTIVNIAIPKMMEYFSCSLSVISWVATGYNLTFAVILITASRLADQFGRKRIFMIGIFLFIITSLMAALSPTVEVLIIARLLQGFSAAFIVPVTTPMALLVVEENKKGLVLALWGAFSGLAATLGPVLGGLLTDSFKWQSVFYINLPIGVLTLILAARNIQESYDNTATKKLDYFGMTTLSAALFSLTFAFAKASDKGWSSDYILILFISATIFTTLFIFSQTKSTAPMISLSLFRIRTFVFSSLTLFILGFGLTSGTLLITLFLTNLMSKSELHAGLIVSTLAFSSMLTSFLSGKMAHRMGGRWLTTFGMLALMFSTIGYGAIRYNSSITLIIILLCCSGLALGLIMSPSMMSAIRQIPEEKVGIASGFVNMTRSLGQALGIALLTTILTTNTTHHLLKAKEQAAAMIDSNTVFDLQTKEQIKASLMQLKSPSLKDQKEQIKQIDEQEKAILAKTPATDQARVKIYFDQVKKEMPVLQERISGIFKDQIGQGFSRSFRFAGILLIIGIVFAFFSDINPRRSLERVAANKKAHLD